MQIQTLVQGSEAWHEFRANHFGASEAAAMLGISTKVKRNDLLHIKFTGNPKEFSDWVQKNILDYGHEVEAMARPLVEELIGDDLYPVTCAQGNLSASCDGLTMAEDIAFEHKQWNEALAAAIRAGTLPDEYMPQCQQVLMVTNASKLIFVCSDGTPERFVHLEVLPDQAWFKRIVLGWEQFAKDLAEYTPKLLAEKPPADAIKNLPALAIQIRGEVLNSNLPAFKAAADEFIANINTELATDEDFANAEATVKYCTGVEENLALTKKAIIGQTATIEDVMLTIDQVSEQVRSKRLTLTNLIKSQKDAIRESILTKAKLTYTEHVAALEAEMTPIRLNYTTPDFAGAMKNKRTLTSLHDAVDTLLANAKIATGEIGSDLRTKLSWIKEQHKDYGFLFTDLQTIIHKPNEDYQLTVNSRVAEHKKAEAEKHAAIVEAERVKAEKAANEKVQAEQAAAVKAAEAAKPATTFQDVAHAVLPTGLANAVAPVTQRDAAPLMTASSSSPVPARTATVTSFQPPAIDDGQIIDVVMDVFSLSQEEAIDRLEKIDFTAARSNLVATAA